MLKECIEALNINPEGIYVDATFGGGGHSMHLLERLKGGRLIAFDQDEDAKKEAEKIQHRSFTFLSGKLPVHETVSEVEWGNKVNGILADLGISSHQIDAADRGFFNTVLMAHSDMRMDQRAKITAAKIVNDYTEVQLHKIFGMYGELKNAKTAARTVVDQRKIKPLKTTLDLKTALQSIAPRGKENKYFAQVFQALRIEVNEEMQALEDFLHQCGDVIEKEGMLVVMSYHSLEDRMTKNYINTGKVFGEVEKDFFGNKIRPFEAVTRKPVTASEKEIEENNRARSAKLRVAAKN